MKLRDPEFYRQRLREMVDLDELPPDLQMYKSELISQPLVQRYWFAVWHSTKAEQEMVLEKCRKVLADQFNSMFPTPIHFSVLDAGCGIGFLVPALDRKEIEYTGLDLSEELIAICKTTYPDKNFQVGDLLQLPFLDGTIDVAVCRGVQGATISTYGQDHWNMIQRELLRVAKALLLINMDGYLERIT